MRGVGASIRTWEIIDSSPKISGSLNGNCIINENNFNIKILN